MGHQEFFESRSTSSSSVEFDDIANATSIEMQPVITSVFSQGAVSLLHNEGSVNATSKSWLKSKSVSKKHKEAKQNKKQFSPYPQVGTKFPRDKNKVPQQGNGSECDPCNDVPFACEKDFIKHAKKKEKQFKIRPFLCTICNISVTTETSLNNHLNKIHRDIRCVVCDICNKAFTRETHLLSHQKLCHPKSQLYECKTCCIYFTEENQLLEHQKNGRHGVQILE